jgi:hypothetical protein
MAFFRGDSIAAQRASRLLQAPAYGYENASAPISTYATDYRTTADRSSI